MNVAEALNWGTDQLIRSGDADSRRDCDYLLSHVVGHDRIWLHLNGNQILNEADAARFEALISRRLLGVPVQYLIETCEFFGIELRVKTGVYIPKRETETLVEATLRYLDAPQNSDLTWGKSQSEALVHEVGTGSGAISIAIARHAPRTQIWAGDISAFAISLARSNARLNGEERSVDFLQSDLQSRLPGIPDVVVANLPYIREASDPDLPSEVRAQPRSSLLSGASGECHIARLLSDVRIKSGGRLFLEIGFDQAKALKTRCAGMSRFRYLKTVRDLAGLDRVAVIESIWPRAGLH